MDAVNAEQNEERLEARSSSILGEGPRPEPPNVGQRDLIQRIASEGDKAQVSAEEVNDAEAFLISAIEGGEEVSRVVDKLRVNVGTPQHPHWIDWSLTAISGGEMRRIRERASAVRAVRRGANGNPLGTAEAAFRSNIDVVIAGTVYPDLLKVAQHFGVDPGTALERALRYKQGLIDQLAGEIVGLSGYDDEDVQDAAEVRAALS